MQTARLKNPGGQPMSLSNRPEDSFALLFSQQKNDQKTQAEERLMEKLIQ